MSCLKLYAPFYLSLFHPAETDSQDSSTAAVADEPVILPFRPLTARFRNRQEGNLLSRTRLIHQNRCCPECGRAAVEPVESETSLMTRNQMPVPGTGTLLGFHCLSCDYEWPA